LTVCGAGSGAEERELKSRAATAHYIVDFTGNLSQAELADRFRLNDIFILPSYYEGLPLVLIEALASELHVVVNDLPGIKSWLGDDLCNSKQIEFVKLPTLCNIDKPVIEEIPAYVSRLHIAIRNALRNHSGTNDRNLNIIRNHTWKAVFQKIGLQIEKAVL
jgi:glycosyltransferase involved in cell wall biosynthesis